MEIYLILAAATLLLGRFMPQEGPERKRCIILMALLQGFVCGFRYQHLTGDLMKYHWEFNAAAEAGWLEGGRNPGFYWLLKAVCHLSGGNFQVLLILIAAVTQIAAAVLIYRYSPAPWLSWLVFNCMGFYISGFSAIKQALAMALVMLAFLGIAERKLRLYLAMMALAGLVHLPALIFLPAYWVVQFRMDRAVLGAYALAGALLWLFREPFAAFLTELYYGEAAALSNGGSPGGRFFLILLIAGAGLLLRGADSRQFGGLAHLMLISALLQMLSGFGNLFTRLADYYFQFSILYIPMIFGDHGAAVLPFDPGSRKKLAAVAAVCLILFYYTAFLNVDIAYAVDDYTNFRFMWDVR